MHASRAVPSSSSAASAPSRELAEASGEEVLEGEEPDGFLEDEEEAFEMAGDDGFELPEASTSGAADDGPFIDIDKTVWGRKALEAAQKVLQGPEMEGLELYSFRAIAKGSVLDVRLDKLDDQYGSPMLEDIETFARALYREMEGAMGEEAAGDITVEASSPGAERKLRIPKELERFRQLPMTVNYRSAADPSKSHSRVFQLSDVNQSEESSVWQLANVRVNRPSGKGAKLTKRQAAERFTIPLKDLIDVRLYIEL